MWEEEYPLPGYKSATECYVAWQFIVLGVMSTWLLAGDFAGGPAICASLAALSLFFYFFYRREVAISTTFGRGFFKRWLFITVLIMGIWSVGQFEPAIRSVMIGDREYLHLVNPDTVGPVTALTGAEWTTLLYVSMMMLSAVGLIAFIQSQHAVACILMTLLGNVMLLTALGLLGVILQWREILTYITPAQANFFATFPAGHQWSAFALFWMVVGFGVLMHLKRRNTWGSLFTQNGIWLIIGWFGLAGSAYYTGAPVHRFLFGIGVGGLLISLGYLLIGPERKGAISVILGAIFGFCGLGLIVYSAFTFLNAFSAVQNDPTQAPFGIPWEVQTALWRDAWALFQERPLFGWGLGSFSEVFAFRQQVDLNLGYYSNPQSDFLQGLVEYGIIGMVLWIAFPVLVFFHFLRLKVRRKLSYYLWGAVTLLGLLSFVAQPLSTPANFVCIWMGIAMAYKWSHAAEQQIKSQQIIRKGRKIPIGISSESSSSDVSHSQSNVRSRSRADA